MIRCAKNGGAARRCFLAIWKKPEGELSRAPPPSGGRLTCAGPVLGAERAGSGGGGCLNSEHPRQLSSCARGLLTRGKQAAFERALKIMTKLLR